MKKNKLFLFNLLVLTMILSSHMAFAAADSNDPYQDIYDENSIKPTLLKRVAGTEDASAFPCCPLTGGHSGFYMQTPSNSSLQELFLNVAKRIQMRLTK